MEEYFRSLGEKRCFGEPESRLSHERERESPAVDFPEKSLLIAVNKRVSKLAVAKEAPAAFANSKPAQGLRVQYANRNAIVAATTMPAMLPLSLSPSPSSSPSLSLALPLSERGFALGTGATGRCFINTPIVNCYHLIKSHFPRAFHDSADQEERLLRQSVIKTAALVSRLVCSLSVSLSLFFSLSLSFPLFLPPSLRSQLSSLSFLLHLYLPISPQMTIMKSLTSTSIDPPYGNVSPTAKSYEITLGMTRPK